MIAQKSGQPYGKFTPYNARYVCAGLSPTPRLLRYRKYHLALFSTIKRGGSLDVVEYLANNTCSWTHPACLRVKYHRSSRTNGERGSTGSRMFPGGRKSARILLPRKSDSIPRHLPLKC
ncbi:unnamed protein product [Tuber melanosporum]|uniref:(Perigord truffle) hypothetical protein n=1 Tax=Tuber melanosporum (strain Mel28) TaxID=656061 RepID=D5G9V9_TUBMM|nr:uncharacterized protein GSTUM_00005096001 [Tuber melanosporum]CAZ81302.1 unnamed protein product [Tuber melanosporum]